MRVLSLALVLASTLSACNGTTVMSTEGYDKSCDIPEDCRIVYVGDVCGCPCDVDAIRSNDYSLWARERSDKQDRCDEVLTCQACPDIAATCEANTCGVSQGGDATDDTDG